MASSKSATQAAASSSSRNSTHARCIVPNLAAYHLFIYARGRRIGNCIQTNGTLLTPEWCRFFKESGFLMGVSIDGPQEFHDEYRRSATNQPTFYKVMRGIDLLNKYGVEWNAPANVMQQMFP